MRWRRPFGCQRANVRLAPTCATDGSSQRKYSGFAAPDEFTSLYDVDDVIPRVMVPNNERTRELFLGYMAMRSEVDHHVGRIIDRLKARGLSENTIVVYTSDHGETFGAYSTPGHKGSPEDVSVRVPLVIRLPGRERSRRRSQLLVGALDLMPTVLGLMGMRIPPECQGRDLSSAILTGDDDAVESVPLFMHEWLPWYGVYTRRWTYSFERVDRGPEALPIRRHGYSFLGDMGRSAVLRSFNTLYDREQDPLQLDNLYGHMDVGDIDFPGFERFGAINQMHCELHDLATEWLARFDDPALNQAELGAWTEDPDSRPIDDIRAGRTLTT